MKLFLKKIFVFVFFLIIILPLVFFNTKNDVRSDLENRMLANKPKFRIEHQINPNFQKDFEKWFNDHIGGRTKLVKINSKLHYYIFNELPGGMRIGNNGQLAPFADLNDYQHKNLVTEEKAKEYAATYQTFSNFLSDLGIQVYFMQLWDKHTIYPEYYPSDSVIKKFGNISLSDQIEKAISENTDMNIIHVKNALIKEKCNHPTFGKWNEPWHWNMRGEYTAYKLLMNSINSNNNNKYKTLDEHEDFNISMVDMGQTINGVHQVDLSESFVIKKTKAKRNDSYLTYIPKLGELHQGYYVNNDVDNKDTLLIMGDSYVNWWMFPQLAESFHKTVMFDANSLIDDQLVRTVDAYNPNIVFFENCERCFGRYDKMQSSVPSMKTHLYKINTDIQFYGDNSNSDSFILKGFSAKENSFTWTDGEEASLFLYIPDVDNGIKLHSTIDVASVMRDKQKITILVNNKIVFDDTVGVNHKIKFDFNMSKSKMILIKIRLPNATSPYDLSLSGDKRKLGIAIKSLKISDFEQKDVGRGSPN